MPNPAPSRPLAGILWMLVTGLCFVAVTALVKVLGPRIPAVESAFLRYVIGLVLLTPLLLRLKIRELGWEMQGLFAVRGILHAVGVGCWFFAMARIPIAEVTALNYLSPVYVTIGAAIFLGETLALRRILAVVAALVGMVIILRPGFREVGPGQIAMLFTGLVFGISYLMTKVLADRADAAMVVAMLSVWVAISLAPVALMHWVWPTWAELGILLCVAFFATAGHFTMTLAMKAAPVAVTQPVTFLQLIWATLLGVAVFAEPVDGWVMVGGGVILASVSYIAWREAKLKRRSVTPAVPATKG
ncbi:DMT family transporter [Marinibacterium profundimaris]|uniref:Peptide ABC transporter permease n=1 Tax=Marinibacterium profundimaris TaxID=1679460 RepID=A0A225NH27_9RHOB|nr:DMT family transporter [Marinibacterium profundimaris]OWU72984.1 peptide ABC transporter permease [Marinibacterium profundimaris]